MQADAVSVGLHYARSLTGRPALNHDHRFVGLGDSRAPGHDGTSTDPEGTPKEHK